MMPPRPAYVACPRCQAVLRIWQHRGGNTFGGFRLWSDGLTESAGLAPSPLRGWRCGVCEVALWTDDLPWLDARFDDRERVVLLKAGSRRIEMIQAIRIATGLGLKATLELEAQLPAEIHAPLDRLGPLLETLRASGAEVEAYGTFPGGPARPVFQDLRELAIGDYDELLAGGAGADSARREREIDVRLEAWRRRNAPFRGGDEAWIRHFAWPEAEQANAARLFELLDVEDPDTALFKAEVARQLERWDECRDLVTPLLDGPRQQRARQFLELIRDRRPELCVLVVQPRR